MELNVKKFSLAALITAVLLYVVCVIFVAIAPDTAMMILGGLMHITNASQFLYEAEVTFNGVLLGIIPVLIYSYLGAFMFASIYNKFVKR